MTDYDEPTETDTCSTCWYLSMESPEPRRYAMAPSRSGGWKGWAMGLANLFRRIGDDPLQVFIVQQPEVSDRYLQGLIGHGLAWVEVSSNHYLTGSSRLTVANERQLLALGWQPPSPANVARGLPNNWWRPIVNGEWPQLACLLATTAATAVEFSEHELVELKTFTAANPCRACAWGDDLSEWS